LSSYPKITNNSVIGWTIGGNDIVNQLFLLPPGTFNPAILVNNITTGIQQLYTAGFRTFLVGTVPNIAFKLNQLPDNVDQIIFVLVQLLKQLVGGAITQLGNSYGGSVRFILVDFAQALANVDVNPGLYNFTDSVDICCQDPVCNIAGVLFNTSIVCSPENSYARWDPIHLTTNMHQIVANQAYIQLLPPVNVPPSTTTTSSTTTTTTTSSPQCAGGSSLHVNSILYNLLSLIL